MNKYKILLFLTFVKLATSATTEAAACLSSVYFCEETCLRAAIDRGTFLNPHTRTFQRDIQYAEDKYCA